MEGKIPLLIDTDPGVDDALAVLMAFNDPRHEVVGLTVAAGNVGLDHTVANALRLVELGGADVPVFPGCPTPLVHPAMDAANVHGADGFGDAGLPPSDDHPASEDAAELLLRLSHEHAGQLHVVAVGPLTNLALALRADPTLPARIREVTIMGGAALHPGNVTPVAEANIAVDPEAAAAVLAADWDLTLVPLDVTMENLLEESGRAALLEAGTDLAPWLGSILDLYFAFHEGTFGRRCSALHDPLAAAIAVGGVSATVAPRVHVAVDDTQGPGRGQTLCDLRGLYTGHPDQPGARCRVVLETDRPLAPHLLERLLSL